MNKIIVILGPTAVGKSAFGVNLAKEINGEIISADSVQIFKELNIGSGKVTKGEMQGIKHHCVDILEPQEEFSVFDFVKLTKQKIEEISNKNKTPIIVGGTGLYVKGLIEGYDFGKFSKESDFRKNLEEKSFEELLETLILISPEMAEKIEKNNKKRLIRALEIAKFGKMPSKCRQDFDVYLIYLNQNRQELYNKINSRTLNMFEKGLIEEVRNLVKKGLTMENQSMKAIGYKEVIAHLNNDYNLERCKELTCQHARNYAKRQLTFFRGLEYAKEVCVDFDGWDKNEITKIKEWLCQN